MRLLFIRIVSRAKRERKNQTQLFHTQTLLFRQDTFFATTCTIVVHMYSKNSVNRSLVSDDEQQSHTESERTGWMANSSSEQHTHSFACSVRFFLRRYLLLLGSITSHRLRITDAYQLCITHLNVHTHEQLTGWL